MPTPARAHTHACVCVKCEQMTCCRVGRSSSSMLRWVKLKPHRCSQESAFKCRNTWVVPLFSSFHQLPCMSSCSPSLSHVSPHNSHSLLQNGPAADVSDRIGLLLSYFTTGQFYLAQSLFAVLFQNHTHFVNYRLRELSKNGLYDQVLHLYNILRLSTAKPNRFTYACVFKACAALNAFTEAKLIHSHVIKSGFGHNVIVANSLVDAYSKVGSLESACGVFDEMGERNLVSWNCMISGYAMNGFPRDALKLCGLMRFEVTGLDKVTLKIVLHACGLLGEMHVGESVHAHVVAMGLSSDTRISTAIMDMYAKCDVMDSAEKLFYNILHKDTVTWNVMISGYSRKGQLDMVLNFFCKMLIECVEPSVVTMLVSLQACADLPSLITGQTIHGSVVKIGFSSDASVEALLVSMYSKCGRLDLACQVQLTVTRESVNSWSAMIHGLGMHGYGEAALMGFFRMLKRGIDPDGVCFLLVLSSCSHNGMVSEGYRVFDYMVEAFGIEPKIEHFATMVDLIGRAGFINEAFQFVERLPMEPDISIWSALSGACKKHGKFDMLKSMEESLVGLDPKTAGYYKLLVSTHASKEEWDRVHNIRSLISKRGIQRVVGHSLLQVEMLAS